ncbi:alpha/beta fold hydrolase [Wenzhouxiangella sp. XN79A]|uniref:YheT family hydrolase n=1 Tax=Wenzhouxiangella sp. XN79A TaxID=2724193 RepID=UPI00144A8674|nr:alpha/beta fold hydrolase [Wenzhouxiangella sp. XN79A]NKI34589.1 alpha/beta fold hydrolase [Wenzhouxiangella sp. XN79A]
MPTDSPIRDPGPYAPAGWLANAHVQSILTSSPLRKLGLRRRSRAYRTASRDEILTASDGTRLLGHHSVPARPNGGLAILLHGWEGSAESNYLLDAALALDAAGFETFRLNFRDHGPSHHLNEGLFHSCLLDEVLDAVGQLADRHRPGPVFLVGFSLGGNFALRVARNAPAHGFELDRVVAVSPVIRPKHVLKALEEGLSVYEQYFVRKWRRSLKRKQALYPERYNLDPWLRHRNLNDQTRWLVEAYTEFPDLDAYLEGYSIAGDYLDGLTVSSLVVTAADDPIIPVGDFEALPRPPALDLEILEHGGHCGFLSSWRMESWIQQRIVSELCLHLNRT